MPSTSNPANHETLGDRSWEVPYPRNPHFVGRESYLAALRKHFIGDAAEGKHQALYGLGGMGKSQIALEYAYRHREAYTLVWWLPAEDPTALGLAYSRLARAVGLKLGPDVSLDDVRHRVRRVLSQLSDWLIIFDNAADAGAIKNFLPLQRSGHVLITSQSADWGDVAMPVPVRPLQRSESIEFLHKRVPAAAATADAGDAGDLADKLAQSLGDLPLALEQAAVVMEQTHTGYDRYLKRFETHWAELLQEGLQRGDHPDSLGMTLELSFRQIEEDSPASAALMYFCAFLAPDNIGKQLLKASVELLPPPLSGGVLVGLDSVLAPLVRFSLIDDAPDAISLHRLVAALTRRRLTADEQKKWCASAAQALAAYYQYNSDEPATWPGFAAGIPHMLAASNHATNLSVVPDVVADLLSNAGRYLLKQGRLDEARSVLERAIDLTRRVYGNAHPRTSNAANNLGRVLQRQGDATAAAEHFALSLSIDQAVYGQDDPRVATVANNYGMCLLHARDLAAAIHHFNWALQIFEKSYGSDYPKLAPILNNLGCALRDTSELAAASDAFSRGLAIAESGYSPDHPTTASLLYNFGQLLRAQGDLDGAENYLRRALVIDEQAYGQSHPDVARDLIGLSKLLLERGERDESQKFAGRAQRILAASPVTSSN
jgi:tetratricopeptide (TPR) repeat protein